MAAIVGAAMKEFVAAHQRGQLPAASPYVDSRTEAHGLAASGIEIDDVEDLVWSDDRMDRAAAAIIACTNVARAAEQQNSALRFPRFERRQARRVWHFTGIAATQPDRWSEETTVTFLSAPSIQFPGASSTP